LRQYRRVHFATHGAAVPEAPGLSALVLSQAGASDSLAARDGFLTMDEIARLRMRADVAVLSACQTGLGKVVAGEGVVSLSHAFLRAGADATLVSHWKVLDRSTQQFMAAVYRRSRKTDTSFLEAVTEAKRAFIAGHHGPKSTDPLRWAPFVYYGRE
jgi:CHAT domain-containing protein